MKKKHLCETNGHQRLISFALTGAVVAIVPLPVSTITHGLIAWCVAAAVYLALAWWLAYAFDTDNSTRQHAQAQDQPSVVLLVLVLFTAFASTAAIASLQQSLDQLTGLERVAHLTLSVSALGCSWLLIQTVFAFRYAHRFYGTDAPGQPHSGGLDFPGDGEPDYLDFHYYASVVGMTSQVSDVVVVSREMRFLTMVHSLLSFAFNMLVVALSINMMASAIK